MSRLSRLVRSPRFKGWLRVFACLTVFQVIVAAVLLRTARARGAATLQEGGLKLLEHVGPDLVGEAVEATINGQRLSIASQFSPLPIPEVLDRFERHCQANSGGLAEEVSKLPEGRALGQLPSEFRDPSRWLTSRQIDASGKVGQVVCLVRRTSGGGVRGLVDQIMRFVDTGDLAELGGARYVVARREKSDTDTHVLAIWSDGSFNIPNMFPAEGDAPGRDSPYVPRPFEARRVFSAEIEGRAYALRMYDSRRSNADVLRQYAEALPKSGWLPHPMPPLRHGEGEGEDLGEHFSAYTKGSAAVVVVVEDTPDDLTGVTLIEMGGRGFAQIAGENQP